MEYTDTAIDGEPRADSPTAEGSGSWPRTVSTHLVGASSATIEQTDDLPGAAVEAIRAPSATQPDDELDQLLEVHGRTFSFAARFMQPEQRQAAVTLYAYFRTLDDLVDEPTRTPRPMGAREEVCAWRGWFLGTGSYPPHREALALRLAPVLDRYTIPGHLFSDFLGGLLADLDEWPIETYTDLRRYCYQVAGTVGRAMSYVLGATSPQALDAAEQLGVAMQLTNILRDIGGDLARGRVYLPAEELLAYGLTRDDLARLARQRHHHDQRFLALMRFQVERARVYYSRGMSGIWLLPGDARLPILIAGRLYRRILVVIERNNFDVLHSRASTNLREKVQEAAMALLLEKLWRHGEGVTGAHTPRADASREWVIDDDIPGY